MTITSFYTWAEEAGWLCLRQVKPSVESTRTTTHYNGYSVWLTPAGDKILVEYNAEQGVYGVTKNPEGLVP